MEAQQQETYFDNTQFDKEFPKDSLLHEIVEETFQNWTLPYEIALKDAYYELRQALPDESESFIKAAWLQFRRNPKLQSCSQESIKAAAVRFRLSGLDITQEGQGFFVPLERKGKLECEAWPGYIGRLFLARQHPAIMDAWALEVRENDTYKPRGYNKIPKHRYPKNFGPRGDVIGAYCVVEFANGRVRVHELGRADALAHRNQFSRGYQRSDSPWQEWRNGQQAQGENRNFATMILKTAVNQLIHPRHVPMNRHAAAMIMHEDAAQLAANAYSRESKDPVATPTSEQAADIINEINPTMPDPTLPPTPEGQREDTPEIATTHAQESTNAPRQGVGQPEAPEIDSGASEAGDAVIDITCESKPPDADNAVINLSEKEMAEFQRMSFPDHRIQLARYLLVFSKRGEHFRRQHEGKKSVAQQKLADIHASAGALESSISTFEKLLD